MKVTFQTQELGRALERVQRAAQNKVTSNTNNGFFIACDRVEKDMEKDPSVAKTVEYLKTRIERHQ